MGFTDKLKSLKDKAIDLKNKAVDSAAKKFAESSLVLKNKEDLDKIITKSKTTTFTDEKTLETKTFIKHSIVIFIEKDSEFYKDALIQVPVLATKAFASNINLKMCNLDLKDLKKYKIKETPVLALFTDEKLVKLIAWEENIKTIVKTLDLDIIKAIENI